MIEPVSRWVDVGLKLHVREWAGEGQPFVLLHGLASNSLTWLGVGSLLAQAGHHVIAVDQRGHGLSDKPDSGYDFDTVTDDLRRLIEALGLQRPIVAGQSWGGNVVLAFGARHAGVARGLAFVDGGFLHLRSRFTDWETTAQQLRPPPLTGTPRATLKSWIAQGHPDWEEWGAEATLGNFETLADGTIRPYLTLERHLLILRSLWEQNPVPLFPQVREGVLVCVALNNPERDAHFIPQVEAAERGLARCHVEWFQNTDHDIHVQRPAALTALFQTMLTEGVWA
jgi:pimeloyl-ACP methyl ester carboxylesterase